MRDKTESERAYIEGRRFTLVRLLTQSMKELMEFGELDQSPLIRLAELIKERQETVSKLRELCGKYGDNEWRDNSHLADVVEKHLIIHIRERIP